MHMRIAWGTLKPGKWDDYERAYAASVKGKKIKGLKARYLVRDSARPDAGFSITLWSSEKAMRAYESDATLRAELLKPIEPYFSGEFAAHRCEVRLARKFG